MEGLILRNNRPKIVESLIAAPHLAHRSTNGGHTPLELAAKYNRHELVEVFLTRDACNHGKSFTFVLNQCTAESAMKFIANAYRLHMVSVHKIRYVHSVLPVLQYYEQRIRQHQQCCIIVLALTKLKVLAVPLWAERYSL